MNVVLYLRYSSEKQNEQSIEGQQRICTEYCKRNGMNIVDVYVDRALSASKDIEKREDFQRMIRDSDKGTFGAVIVYKLDRFSRNRYDSATYKNKLKKNGVRVISATENISEDPEGIILESLLEGMAEYYSRELAQKVSRGMHETALKGNSCGGTIALGYKIQNKKFVIDEKTAPIVKEIFQRYADGENFKDIADDLNQRGFRSAKGALFNKNSFKSILKNEKYIGVYKYKNVRKEDAVPAIIDKDLFDVVQKKIKALEKPPRKSTATVPFLLVGKLFCGHCGSMMIGDSGTSKGGKTHYYYSCSSRKNTRSCDKKSIRKDMLEMHVVEDAISLLTPENIVKLADAAIEQAEKEAKENTNIQNLTSELRQIQQSISNLIKLVERGSDSEQLFARLDELEHAKKITVKKLEEAEHEIVKLDRDQIIWFLSKFANGDPNDQDYRRRVIDMLVNNVTVWDEPDGYRITFTYNLTSLKTKTVKFSKKDFEVFEQQLQSSTKSTFVFTSVLFHFKKHLDLFTLLLYNILMKKVF